MSTLLQRRHGFVRVGPRRDPKPRLVALTYPLALRFDAAFGAYQDAAALAAKATADADPVGAWADALGAVGLNVTASQRPLLKTAVKNGLPVIRFDRVDDRLALPTLQLSTSHSLVCAVKVISYGSDDILVGNNGSNYLLDLTTATLQYAAGVSAVQAAAITVGTWYVLSVVRNDLNVEFRRNGVSLGTKALTANNPLAVTTLGGAGGSFLFGGDLAEAWINSPALSAAQVAAVEALLNAKYAIF